MTKVPTAAGSYGRGSPGRTGARAPYTMPQQPVRATARRRSGIGGGLPAVERYLAYPYSSRGT